MNRKIISDCRKICSIFLITMFLSSNFMIAASAAETSMTNYSDSNTIMSTASITSDADLQIALLNANPGDTIVLTEDLALTGIIMINKSITIDGAGYTLSLADGNANRHFNISARAEAILENITLRGHGDNIAGGGIFITNSTIHISGSTITDNVSATDGGGIYAFGASDVKITNGSRIINNTASNGYGGGIYAINNTAVNIDGNSIISGNFAQTDGGGIYTNDLSLLTTDSVTFDVNSAGSSNEWTLDVNSNDPVVKAASILHQTNILNTTYSTPFTNAYNNFDIFYDGTNLPGIAATITVNYYQDTLDESNLLESISFGTSVGVTLDETDFIGILGANWVNDYKPEGYEDGRLEINLPLTVETEEVTIDILYLNTVTDEETEEETEEEIDEEIEEEVPKTGDNNILWSFVLLILSTSECLFLFRKKKKDYSIPS